MMAQCTDAPIFFKKNAIIWPNDGPVHRGLYTSTKMPFSDQMMAQSIKVNIHQQVTVRSTEVDLRTLEQLPKALAYVLC